jgi:hypothetical protein
MQALWRVLLGVRVRVSFDGRLVEFCTGVFVVHLGVHLKLMSLTFLVVLCVWCSLGDV